MIPRLHDIRIMSITAPAFPHPVFILRGPPGHPCYVAKKERATYNAGDGMYDDPWTSHEPGETAERRKALDAAKRIALDHHDLQMKSYEFIAATYQGCLDSMPDYRTLDSFEVIRLFNRLRAANRNEELVPADVFEDHAVGALASKQIWILMDCIDGLQTFEGFARKLRENDADARTTFTYLRHNPDTAAELGRIIALDVFFGNNDRADFLFDGRTYKGDTANVGNFFLVRTGEHGQAAFVGIDFYEPNKAKMNLFCNFLSIKDSDGTLPWAGPLLIQNSARQKGQVESVLDGLNRVLTEGGQAPLFDADHKRHFLAGFKDGAARIKKYLKKTKNKPPAVKQRRTLLGW